MQPQRFILASHHPTHIHTLFQKITVDFVFILIGNFLIQIPKERIWLLWLAQQGQAFIPGLVNCSQAGRFICWTVLWRRGSAWHYPRGRSSHCTVCASCPILLCSGWFFVIAKSHLLYSMHCICDKINLLNTTPSHLTDLSKFLYSRAQNSPNMCLRTYDTCLILHSFVFLCLRWTSGDRWGSRSPMFLSESHSDVMALKTSWDCSLLSLHRSNNSKCVLSGAAF